MRLFTLGQTSRYDIGWCGLGSGNALDELTDVVVCLPAGTAQQTTLCYTTADGEEVRTEIYAEKNATLVQLEGTVLAESIRLE